MRCSGFTHHANSKDNIVAYNLVEYDAAELRQHGSMLADMLSEAAVKGFGRTLFDCLAPKERAAPLTCFVCAT